MGKSKVVLDTNILISALGWKGNPHKILEIVTEGDLELFISYDQFEELSRVLNYPKFNFSEDQKARFKELISEVATFVKTPIKLDIIKSDPSDNRILECALVAGIDYIVSGDPDLLLIKSFKGIKIVKARRFLEEL